MPKPTCTWQIRNFLYRLPSYLHVTATQKRARCSRSVRSLRSKVPLGQVYDNRKLWPLTWKRSLRYPCMWPNEWDTDWPYGMHGWERTGERLKKIFAQMNDRTKFLHGCTAKENWSRWRLPHHVSSQLKLNMSYIIFAAKWYGDNNIFLSKQKSRCL